MDNETREQMNVARPHVSLRIVMWLCFLLFLSGLVGSCLTFALPPEDPNERPSIGDVPLILVQLGFASLCLWGLMATYTVYHWNEEEIRTTCFRHERCMRWGDIVSFRVRTFGGDMTYILRDALGRRLTVDIQLLGRNSPVHKALREKLAHFAQDELTKIAACGEAHFSTAVAGITLILYRDSLLYKAPRWKNKMLFSEIDLVYQQGAPTWGTVELISRVGTRIRIPPSTRGYGTVVSYIRDRAKNALWINMNEPAPEEEETRSAYVQRATELVREQKKSMWVAVLLAAIMVGLVLCPCILFWPSLSSLRDTPGETPWWIIATVCLSLIVILFLYVVCRAVQQTFRWRSSLRDT